MRKLFHYLCNKNKTSSNLLFFGPSNYFAEIVVQFAIVTQAPDNKEEK